MKYLFITITLFTVLTGMISCSKKVERSKEKPPVNVDIVIACLSDFPKSIEVNGTALSEEMIELYPEIGGRLVYLNIPDGEEVAKGTILAKVNDAELQAELEKLKVQLELAVSTEKRLLKLLNVNGVNQSEYDASLSQVNTLNANIKVLNAQIDKTIIRAPFNGNLGLRTVSPGSYVTPQTKLGTLQQLDKIKIDFTVPESYAELVNVGGTVKIHLNSSDELHTAEISALEPQINPDTRNLKVRARLLTGKVSPGSFVKVIININEQRISIPSNAIIPNANANQVIIIKNNKPIFTDVETGLRNSDDVEILKGINSGDSVITGGILFVRPNSILKIRKVNSQDTGNIQD